MCLLGFFFFFFFSLYWTGEEGGKEVVKEEEEEMVVVHGVKYLWTVRWVMEEDVFALRGWRFVHGVG